MGLFMLVYGVEHTGVLALMGQKLLDFTGGDIALTGIVVLWSSAILSAIVDSANVMVASYAERAGHRIGFIQFLKLAFPMMLATIAIAHVYVQFVYFGGW